jgi:hypothetical protein
MNGNYELNITISPNFITRSHRTHLHHLHRHLRVNLFVRYNHLQLQLLVLKMKEEGLQLFF